MPLPQERLDAARAYIERFADTPEDRALCEQIIEHWYAERGAHYPDLSEQSGFVVEAILRGEVLPEPKVMEAVNAGADLALGAMADAGFHDEAAANISNLVVCAIGTVLNDPDATIVDVLLDNFQGTIEQWRTELGDDVVDQALTRTEET